MGFYIIRDNNIDEDYPYVASIHGFYELEHFIYDSIFDGKQSSEDYPALSYFLKEGYSADLKNLKKELMKIQPKAPAPSAFVVGKLIGAMDGAIHEVNLV